MTTMRWITLPLLLLGSVGIAAAQIPKLLDAPVAGTQGFEFTSVFPDNPTPVLRPDGIGLLMINGPELTYGFPGENLVPHWHRRFTGNIQAGFSGSPSGTILAYNAALGQVVEIAESNGAVLRLVGTYELGRTLHVGAGFFGLSIVNDQGSTIVRIYNTTTGAFFHEWKDEVNELLTGNRGFVGGGADQYFYSRRQRIKLDTKAVTTFNPGSTNAMFAGWDLNGYVAQAIYNRNADGSNGAFVRFRVLRPDGTTVDLPVPAAGTTQSFAGFQKNTPIHHIGLLVQTTSPSGVLGSSIVRYRTSDGVLASTFVYGGGTATQFPAEHVPFGSRGAYFSGRIVTRARSGLALFEPSSSPVPVPGTRVGEFSGSVQKVLPTLSGAFYSSVWTMGGQKREDISFLRRQDQKAAYYAGDPGTFTTSAIPSALDASPSYNVAAVSSFGRTGTSPATYMFTTANRTALATLAQGLNSIAFVNDTDFWGQWSDNSKIQLFRRTGSAVGVLSTVNDFGTLPLTASTTKVAVTTFTASRKDIKVYDAAGVAQTIALTTQPLRVRFGTDGVLNVVSLGAAANQIKVDRWNVTPATPASLTSITAPFATTDATALRAAINDNGRVLAVYGPSSGAATHFAQNRSTLRLYRLSDLTPIETYTDFAPNALSALEMSNGAVLHTVTGVNAPSYTVPPFVDKMSVPSTIIGGGDTVNLTVFLPFRPLEATTVALAQSGGITMASSVVIPANGISATIPISVDQTLVPSTKTITATVNGVSTVLTLSIVPPRPSSVVIAPSSVTGGAGATGTVNIIGVAPAGGLTVNLSSNNASGQSAASVVVPAGTKTVNFPITTTPNVNDVTAKFTATANGGSAIGNLNILYARVSTFTTDASTVQGGNKVKATVTLTGPAPTGGQTVTVTSSNATAIASTTIVVPAGATTASKLLDTNKVYPDQTANLTGTYKASSVATSVLVKAARAITVVVSPNRVQAGDSVTAFILLDSAAAASYPLTLTINGVTTTVPVATGAVFVSFTFTAPAVAPGVYHVTVGNALGTVMTPLEIIP